MVNNPYFFSTMATAPSTQIADSSDNPHSGLIKALSIGMTGSYAIKTSNDFAITVASASTVTVAAGKILRDGLKVDIGASGTLTLGTVDSAGATKINTLYSLIVVAANNSLAIRTTTTEEAVPAYTLGDIPVALLLYTGDTNMEIQFLTTNKTSNSLNIGYDSSGYNESLSVSASAGDTTFENKVTEKDIIFKVNDGGTVRELLRLDSSDMRVQITSDVDDANKGPILELRKDRPSTNAANNDFIGEITFTGDDAGGSRTEYAKISSRIGDESAGAEDGQLFIRTIVGGSHLYNLKFTSTQTIFNATNEDIDVRIDGAADNLFYADSSANKIGIGTNSPSSALEIQDGLTTTGAVLTLSTKEPSVVANDVLGKINFQAPLDTGADSDLVSASIHAEAQATFSDTVNQTSIVFSTGASETATEKARITSGGKLGIGESLPDAPLHVKYTGTGDCLILESTDSGTSSAPDLTLLRSSSSPADNDVIGNIQFKAIDDGDDEETFVSIVGQIADATDASIDGRLKIYIKENGSSPNHVLEIAEGTLGLEERSAVGSLQNNTTYGRIWIKNDNPNNLYFTNGDDNSIQLTNGATGPLLTGKHSIWIPAEAISPRSNAGCADLATTAAATSGRPDIRALAFDKDSDEHGQFTIAMPKMWNEGTITAQFYWTNAAATSGTVHWGLQGVSLSNDNPIDTAFGTAIVTGDTQTGTAKDVHISPESSNITIAGSPAANDLTCFQVYRDVSADNLNEDALLLGIKLFYTINGQNDE